MKALPQKHLMNLKLTVGLQEVSAIGHVPIGLRLIVPVTGGTFSGERLNGVVQPGGADWVLNRPDGVMLIDVRLTLKTDDDVLIYLTYQGRLLADKSVMERLGRGQPIDSMDYSLATIAKFECGHADYAWLNNVIAVGTGEQTESGPMYDIYELG